ncbi:MAG: hydrogenase iron-sulfur subunit [Thermoguttaceae bacterium]|nr:hydrogenase iron-sulfur subunit [Thermoguttaceae bacterium]MDW8079489.1 hydrogenase iron-sulfur subunit [Thermoguttaceae bacterium]
MAEPERESFPNAARAFPAREGASGSDRLAGRPVVVAFACTYCAYTAADLAGAMRLSYPAEVRIVQVPCTGKIDICLLLDAFEHGADAVFVAGCNLGDCHFREGNVHAKKEVARCRRLLREVGLEPERLEFFHVPASAASLFADCAREMTKRACSLGPNPLRATPAGDLGKKLALPEDLPPAIPPQDLGKLKTDRANQQKGA